MKIDEIEKILKTKRGWISNKTSKAVFVYSGGLDSTCTIAKLIKDLGIEIFPLFIDRGQRNIEHERKSVRYFEKYFQKEFPGLFHNVVEVIYEIPPLAFKKSLLNYAGKNGYPLRNNQIQFLGVQYAVYLTECLSERISTVLCSQMPDDPFPHSTLISLRLNTLTVCQSLNEWDWQITSPCLDHKFFGKDYHKHDLITWADKNRLPLEKTRSCYNKNYKSCGVCLTCRRRKEAFRLARVTDKTKYER